MNELQNTEDKKVLTKQDLPEIIQRYVNGESIQTIAADARKARNTIYQWIHGVGDTEYREIVSQAMITRLANADHDLSIASTVQDIARAREECRYTRWDLERRRPRDWGMKTETKTDTNITVVVQTLTSTPQPVVIEGSRNEPEGQSDVQVVDSIGEVRQ